MRCPFCGHIEDKVVDSREAKDGDAIRRRRECLECGRRFTSYERIDEIPYMVVKKDGRRETFDRQKILNGLRRACEKRPISMAQLEAIVDDAEKEVQESLDRELSTSEIGKVIMRRLKNLDKVAYVRFASVYLEFEDVSAFMNELKALVSSRSTNSTPAKKPVIDKKKKKK
jgi:transcriptional repressor NrdR